MKKETKEKIMQVVEDFCRREIREQPIRAISYDDSKARMAKLLAAEEIEERDAGRIVGAYFYHYAEHRESTHEDIFAAVKEEIAKILDEYDDDESDNPSPIKEPSAQVPPNVKTQEVPKNDNSSPNKEKPETTENKETNKTSGAPQSANGKQEPQKNSNSSSNKEKQGSPTKEPCPPVPQVPPKPRGTAKQRAIQNLKNRKAEVLTEEALTIAITQEEKDAGDKTLKGLIENLLTQWTLIDTLADHKQDIKLLRERGHSDKTICQKFQDAYPKFGVIPVDYLEIALGQKSKRK